MLARTPRQYRSPAPQSSRGPFLTSEAWEWIVGVLCIAVFTLVAWFVLDHA